MSLERFNELKTKGWKNLGGEEREEFQKLRGEHEGLRATLADPPTPPVSDANARIKALEEMVAKLATDNTRLQTETTKLQEGWAEYVPPAKRNKEATLKVYRADSDAAPALIVKMVVHKHNAFNEETRKNDKLIYKVTVRADDGSEKAIEMDSKQFTEIKEVEKVEIIKEESRTLRKVDGYVTKPMTDKDGYPKRILGAAGNYGNSMGTVEVPLEVFAVKSTVTVKRKNGQQFTLDADYLNL